MIKESAEVVGELVQDYPPETVLERVKELYKAELGRVMAELGQLLPLYQSRVSEGAYRRDKTELTRVQTHLHGDSLSLQGLESTLKYLLTKQLRITNVLQENSGDATRESFGLECLTTGTLKAYKQMTKTQAHKLNLALAAEDSYCRWVRAATSSAPSDEVQRTKLAVAPTGVQPGRKERVS